MGEEVGYHVRFDSRVSTKTKIIYLTDGMIFRFLQNPSNLKEVDLIIFDEFHERSLFMDASWHWQSLIIIAVRLMQE